ncbi:SSI family serine proteinase inhibitor [Streptomyces sp. NRRL S-920]|uniref:SSI family serine proteinase inhibitor n=1 Tax=Streptomyces sp. NRRL S-920 TaxID=1463921 RepID=UPI0004C619F9|nr:SSI family serine proteinase inhibitor [Streptomyces sp. NRRL S-920]
MLRRLVLTAAASAAALSAAPFTAHAVTPAETPTDRLTITVSDSEGDGEGTYELRCHPTGGNHPKKEEACARLDEVTVYGRDPFAPVRPDAMCTMQHGGDATAHIRGTWQGRPVDATYSRRNGCEIARWDGMAPVLPRTS